MSAPQKLVLIGNFLPDRQESMQRFARVLAHGFSSRGLAVETWRPEPRFARLAGPYRYGGLPKYFGYIDKFVIFPRRLRRLVRAQPQGTVYHIVDHSNAVYARHLPAASLTLTCHDLLQIRSARNEFPQNRLSRSGQKYQEWILSSLSRLPRAACISEKTRTDLLRLAGLRPDTVSVIPNGLNYPYQPIPPKEAQALFDGALRRHSLVWPRDADAGVPFLFGIGGAQWYKNRSGLLRLFAETVRRLPRPAALVYVGPPFEAEQTALLQTLKIENRVLRIPSLTDEELRAAYNLAAGLLFPSWEEGFGWPIAEAQACGCPVFTSNRPPMSEVAGPGALTFDPARPDEAAERIVQGLASPEPLRAAGRQNSLRWDPQVMLDAYWKIYDSLVPPPS